MGNNAQNIQLNLTTSMLLFIVPLIIFCKKIKGDKSLLSYHLNLSNVIYIPKQRQPTVSLSEGNGKPLIVHLLRICLSFLQPMRNKIHFILYILVLST